MLPIKFSDRISIQEKSQFFNFLQQSLGSCYLLSFPHATDKVFIDRISVHLIRHRLLKYPRCRHLRNICLKFSPSNEIKSGILNVGVQQAFQRNTSGKLQLKWKADSTHCSCTELFNHVLMQNVKSCTCNEKYNAYSFKASLKMDGTYIFVLGKKF